MKGLVISLVGFIALALAPSSYGAPESTLPSGTQYGAAASVLSFNKTIRDLLVINNESSTSTLYVKLNETGTSATATVSTLIHDFVLLKGTSLILTAGEIDKLGVTSLSLYIADATPTAVVVGW